MPDGVDVMILRGDENLRDAGWFFLTILCLFAVGTIRSWAARRQNEWLLVFLTAPLAVLAFEAWFVGKSLTLAFFRDWRELLMAAWVVLTFYLWVRGNGYKEDCDHAQAMLREKWERDRTSSQK